MGYNYTIIFYKYMINLFIANLYFFLFILLPNILNITTSLDA